MIKRLVVLFLTLVPIVAIGQTKPNDVTTMSRDRDVQRLARDVDRAFDDSYSRCRIRDVLMTNWIYGTDTSQSTGFIGVKPGGSGMHFYGLNENTGGSSSGAIVLHEAAGNGSNYIGITTPNVTTSYTFKLPPAAGGIGTVLMASDPPGVSIWASASEAWIGDTLFQNVFDTIIANNSTTFTLPVAYTSSSSYRVSCTATDNTSPNINWAASNGGLANVWGMIRIRQASSTTFTVTLRGYTDENANQWAPGAGDSLTCNCVASGR